VVDHSPLAAVLYALNYLFNVLNMLTLLYLFYAGIGQLGGSNNGSSRRRAPQRTGCLACLCCDSSRAAQKKSGGGGGGAKSVNSRSGVSSTIDGNSVADVRSTTEMMEMSSATASVSDSTAALINEPMMMSSMSVGEPVEEDVVVEDDVHMHIGDDDDDDVPPPPPPQDDDDAAIGVDDIVLDASYDESPLDK
jgi:hypothetical protein